MSDQRYNEIIESGMNHNQLYNQPDWQEFVIRRDSGNITSKHQAMRVREKLVQACRIATQPVYNA